MRIILFVGRARRARLTIAELCNGSTHDSDSCCLGSNPSSAASISLHGQAVKTSPSHGENWGSSPHGGTNIVHALHGRFFCPHARGLRRRVPACAQAFSRCRGPSAPQTVEKPQESARGPQPSRISIVVGGMYGDHGADFALQNRFFAVFATGIACNSSKNW